MRQPILGGNRSGHNVDAVFGRVDVECRPGPALSAPAGPRNQVDTPLVRRASVISGIQAGLIRWTKVGLPVLDLDNERFLVREVSAGRVAPGQLAAQEIERRVLERLRQGGAVGRAGLGYRPAR